MQEKGVLYCARCAKEITTGMGIKFIRFHTEILMFHKLKCYDKAKEAAQLKKETETEYA